ncbi:hypothetical protein [Shimazuella soli]|uniref:hypothetical protein n=1 Tax=Shimazuella soli TaxID=1892854 RepID=UPI001F1157C9|nr:hypothetical protein [Shimazuella soli]
MRQENRPLVAYVYLHTIILARRLPQWTAALISVGDHSFDQFPELEPCLSLRKAMGSIDCDHGDIIPELALLGLEAV